MATRSLDPQGNPDPIRELLDEKTLADEITKAIEGNDCPKDQDLTLYLRNELGEEGRLEIKSHLIFCTRCQGRTKDLEQQPKSSHKVVTEDKEDSESSFLSHQFAKLRDKSWFKLLLYGAILIFLLSSAYLLRGKSQGFYYGLRIAQGQDNGTLSLSKIKELEYEIVTPEPIFLIEITIDGDGQIDSRIPPSPTNGVFRDKDRIPFKPNTPGEYDIYLVPCPAAEGVPNSLLNQISKFIKTDSSLNRENKRKGIEMALRLYKQKSFHQVYRFVP